MVNHAAQIEEDDTPPAEVLALLEQRKVARDQKDFAASDRLRDQISTLGWSVQDGKEGQKMERRKM